MKLIKQLNEKAKKPSPFKYLDIDSIKGFNDILNEKTNFSSQEKSDMKKLVKQYKSRKELPSGQDLKDQLGDDLEMLEYEPYETKYMIPHMYKQLK